MYPPCRTPRGPPPRPGARNGKGSKISNFSETGFIFRWCAVCAAGYVPLSWPGPAGGGRLQASAAAGLTAPVRSPPSTVNSHCRVGSLRLGAAGEERPAASSKYRINPWTRQVADVGGGAAVCSDNP
ncbi:hypothetical protein PVAP13_6NG326501 [Panicum virgatum]|uniref:Uncharacterized protein n=1 Tax=Panicum virgatum TaxID=38727 RepID=A0A8T0R509_PANVG|nr:hypothetical protein PVAP13_6NG326501 [Panicum virgatum]